MTRSNPAPSSSVNVMRPQPEPQTLDPRAPDPDPTGWMVSSWEPLGLALVRMEDGECLPLPSAIFFRTPDELSELEGLALELCRGSVLDLGAGAGCHSLALQVRGLAVTGVDLSPQAVEVMRQRGLRDARQCDVADLEPGSWDTLLLLMNGLGVVGDLAGLDHFLARCGDLLAEGGQILCDSCDLARIDDPEERARGRWRESQGRHRGETRQQIEYGGLVGLPFGWLYLASQDLARRAGRHGFHSQVVFEDGEGNYLARLVRGG